MHLRDILYPSLFVVGLTAHTFDLSGHHIYQQTFSACYSLMSLILRGLEKDSEFVMPSVHS